MALLLSGVAMLLAFAGPLAGNAVSQESDAPHALAISIDGVISPLEDRHIGRALQLADDQGAVLLIIRLDTPGGLLDSTRAIVERLLSSSTPTVVYVSPRGARAGSAGTFVTAAANFAVMAPGTNIGAATPVSSTGEDLQETLASKVENDAAALIRSIAQERGRNADLLEDTVRSAASYTATEAADGEVVDFIANDLNDLLVKLNGMVAQTPEGPITVATDGLDIKDIERSLLENLLGFLSNPNVSFLLFVFGGIGIIVELMSPGLLVPAIVGIISLILAFVGFGNLPVNWAGVALIALAIVLAAAEVAVTGFGVLGIASIVSLVVGGLLLFAQFGESSPVLPYVGVNRWVIVGVASPAGVGVLYLARQAVLSRRVASSVAFQDAASMVGQSGLVVSAIAPRGTVRIAGDVWTAVSGDGSAMWPGEQVTVARIDGLVITVIRQA